MAAKLKLYVWENVLCDHTCGVMFTLARNPTHAREILQKHEGYYSEGLMAEGLKHEPNEYTLPKGIAIWGGG